MEKMRRAIGVVLIVSVALASSVLDTAEHGACPGGDETCADAADDTSLLSLRRQRIQEAQRMPPSSYPCPVSGNMCAPDQCCPGIKFTLDRTFPCPTSDVSFRGCEVNTEEEIVGGLLQKLTKEEKYRMLRGVGWKDGTWDQLPGYYIGDSGLQEPYGIPSLNMQDNGQGFRTVTEGIIDEVTGWPVTLAISSSWSEADTERWAGAMAREFRAKGANVILGPGVNVHRVARGGRNAEYNSGESPYLGARLTKPYVRGIQEYKVLAVVKHYVGNNQETNRDTVNSIIDERTLWEVYYPPFEAAVEAGVGAAMCAYNLVNGVHACGNRQTLVTDFKETMGFEGFVQSDWWALHSFAADNGVDQEMPGDNSGSQPAWFTQANLDTLSDEKIDDMVQRQLRMIYRHKLFDPLVCQPPECDSSLYKAVSTTPQHQELNRELATKAVTLLKNEGGVLPVHPGPGTKLALIGPACDAEQDVATQLADWTAGSYYNIGGSGRVIAANVTTIFAGVKARCAKGGAGCSVVKYTGTYVDEALAFVAQEKPSVVLICGGATSTESRDRDSLSVDDEAFLVDVAAGLSHVPVVALTMIPAQTLMPWVHNVAAALSVFLAGTYTGDAFASVLFGASNPSAKLPITIPKTEADTILPCADVTCKYSEGLWAGFPGYEGKEVTFPFGHGLSYTTFGYSKLEVTVEGESASYPSACAGGAACVRATVKNTGAVPGIEVAQLYLGFPMGAGEPEILLRGFVRTKELGPNEEVEVVFPLRRRDVQIHSGGWATPNGVFRVHVGASSRDIRLSSSLGACHGALSADSSKAC